MDKTAKRILRDTAPSRVADAAQKLAGDALAEIDASLPRALAGDHEQVRIYVSACGRLTDQMLAVVGPPRNRKSVPWIKAMLQGEAMNAPFSFWVGSLDPGRGTAVAMIAALRCNLPDTKPLSRPARRKLPKWELAEGDAVRFFSACTSALAGIELPLERVRNAFGLNRTEAAALFGVSRQALEGWERNGIPVDRQAKLSTINAIADLLETQLKADRVPAVVRRQAPAYGGRSILEAIEAGAEQDVLEALRAGFDWASGA
jgi:DNA-binding XRE family transcriptional regulator